MQKPHNVSYHKSLPKNTIEKTKNILVHLILNQFPVDLTSQIKDTNIGLDQMSQSKAGFTVKPIKLYFHRIKIFIIEIFIPLTAFYIKGNTLPVKAKTYC